MSTKRCRIYIDESGDHTFNKLDQPDKRHLGLSGVIIETEHYRTHFFPQLEIFKQKHFPHNPDEPVILHRTDIINCKGSFWRLRDLKAKEVFDNELLAFLRDESYHVITAVIDKKANVERHGAAAFHPYHHCLTAILERYCGFLNYYHAEGDVMVESRGGREDHQIGEIFGKQVVEILQSKYNKKISQDRIEGYGRIFLK